MALLRKDSIKLEIQKKGPVCTTLAWEICLLYYAHVDQILEKMSNFFFFCLGKLILYFFRLICAKNCFLIHGNPFNSSSTSLSVFIKLEIEIFI